MDKLPTQHPPNLNQIDPQQQVVYMSPNDLGPSPFDDVVNPPASPEEITALTQSIKEFGVQNPVIAWENSGKNKPPLLAGTRRHAIAVELGLETIPVMRKNFGSREEAKQFAMRDNLERRELSPISRAMMADELWRLFDKAPDKKAKAAEGLGPRKRAALTASIAEGSLVAYRYVLDTDDAQLISDMKSGKLTIHAAHKLAKMQVEGELVTGKPSSGSSRVDQTLEDLKNLMGAIKGIHRLTNQVGENIPKVAGKVTAAERERIRKALSSARNFFDKMHADGQFWNLQKAIQDAEASVS